jgi:SAM-dependent methyltransferase
MTAKDWIRWGEQDPYFAVVSDEKFRREQFQHNRDEFFRSGEVHITRRLNLIERLWIGEDLKRRVVVDFGCGTGRLIIPLSRHYERVIGVDVSPGMIVEARQNCFQRSAVNIEFSLSLDTVPRASVDFVNSSIVFQHIPPALGLAAIEQLLGLLTPGGVAALHVTTKRNRSLPKEFVYLTKHSVPLSRYVFNVFQGKRWNEPLMQMNNYPLYDVLELYKSCEMRELFLEPVYGDSYGFVVYGRKQTPD